MATSQQTTDISMEMMFIGVNVADELNEPRFWWEAWELAKKAGKSAIPKLKVLKHSSIHDLRGSHVLPISIGPFPQGWTLNNNVGGLPYEGIGSIEPKTKKGKGKKGKGKYWEKPAAPVFAGMLMTLRGETWKRLEDETLGLHVLPSEELLLIMAMLDELLRAATVAKVPGGHMTVTKFKFSRDAAFSILSGRDNNVTSITRRTDFILIDDFTEYPIDKMISECFPGNAVMWLSRAALLPGCSMWAGKGQPTANFWTLLCLFARNARDECWTTLLNTTVDVHLKCKMIDWDVLFVHSKILHSHAVHLQRLKNHLVWVVDARTLAELSNGPWVDSETPASSSSHQPTIAKSREWVAKFNKGSMHQVQSSDVTNSKLKVSPNLTLNREEVPLDWYFELPEEEVNNGLPAGATPGADVPSRPGAKYGKDIVTCQLFE